jgi:argininosuccinate lyase
VKKATTDERQSGIHDAASSAADTFPAPIYRSTVLEEIFTSAQQYFLDPLLEIQYAHTLMLARQQIISAKQAAQCLAALEQLDIEEIRRTPYDGKVEDLFFFLEKRLSELCGAENSGRMHTARSRNDVDMTMYRMVLRSQALSIVEALLRLRAVLLRLSSTHRASLMTAHTHNQPAQPTTLGHYLMASVEWLERDMERLRAAYQRMNRSPLGACAITTTGFPIDRSYTAKLLGFDGVQLNSYGAIAAADYLTETCSVLAVSMVNLGRLAQDLLFWSTAEVGYLRLSNAWVQVSSIMPQKRNPVALEHIRILASKAFVQAQGVLVALHNTPFGDINDSEDDLQPLVYTAFFDARRSILLAAGVLEDVQFQTARMEQSSGENFLAVTELADVLVRAAGMGFRTAHEIVSRAVRQLNGVYQAQAMIDAVLELAPQVTGNPLNIDAAILHRALDARNFVDVRKVPGGPAPEPLDAAITSSNEKLADDLAWFQSASAHLAAARKLVRDEVDTLIKAAAV